ncbi:ABC transporter permease [Acidisoma cellulosilytica]|uniref:ABC transporter permease n=1 Tax=Acidisoma cellulosilyticum TaxID=2802395 RepID=A0A964E769_9PROT|nr:ABC transporter permease [Acidisoma cellulosilyticum]MCB8883698.1 ABC transporter permease [Acidisoma cellulosilyticum]
MPENLATKLTATPSPDGRSRIATIVLLLPAFLVFLGLFVAPLSFFFVQSFWKASIFSIVPGFYLDNYIEVFTQYSGPLLRTLDIAFLVATVTTILGFLFAYAVRFSLGSLGNVLLLTALTTLFGGYLVKIYAWLTILGVDGILNSALIRLGLIRQPLQILLYNTGAVVVTLTHYLLPLAILPIYGALREVDETELAAARDMGASGGRAMRDIVLPQIRPALLASFGLCFLLAAGDYVTPALVGSPGRAMFGNFIQEQFSLRMNTPEGAAMSFTLIAASLALLCVVGFVINRVFRAR